MAETKGRKLYTLISECEIVGIWSNLAALINEFNNGSNILSYFKIYRLIKSHTEGGQNLNLFRYDFIDKENKEYQIKIEILK